MYHICISFMWISKIRIVQKNRPFPPFGKILELCPIDGLIRRWNRLQKSFRSKVARLQFLKRRPDIYLAKILPKIPSKKAKRVTKHILDAQFWHSPERFISEIFFRFIRNSAAGGTSKIWILMTRILPQLQPLSKWVTPTNFPG